jgi:hypothetical protein
VYDYEVMDKKTVLINFLNTYLRKPYLNMKPVLRSMKERLKNDIPITERQFQSIIKFLEREPNFVGFGRSGIRKFFDPIIKNKRNNKIGIEDTNVENQYFI